MTSPAKKFAQKYKTSPQNYWLAHDLYWGEVKKNKTLTLKDIHQLLNDKGVKISYISLWRWVRKEKVKWFE